MDAVLAAQVEESLGSSVFDVAVSMVMQGFPHYFEPGAAVCTNYSLASLCVCCGYFYHFFNLILLSSTCDLFLDGPSANAGVSQLSSAVVGQ